MNDQENDKPGLRQVVGSVLAAFIGVQSERNRERDFTKGRALSFVVVGLIMTLAFVVVVWLVVQGVLSAAG